MKSWSVCMATLVPSSLKGLLAFFFPFRHSHSIFMHEWLFYSFFLFFCNFTCLFSTQAFALNLICLSRYYYVELKKNRSTMLSSAMELELLLRLRSLAFAYSSLKLIYLFLVSDPYRGVKITESAASPFAMQTLLHSLSGLGINVTCELWEFVKLMT